MMVSELISIYNKKLEQTTNTLNEIRAKAERNEQAAEALEARAKKKRAAAEKLRQSMKKVETVGWKEEVIEPLSEELARRLGKKARVYGPYGIGVKFAIVLVDDEDGILAEQEWDGITVEPAFDNDGTLYFQYETGEVCDRYAKGTLGQASGLNNITARLPDSVEEILGLLRHHEAVIQKSEEGQGSTDG